MQFVRMVRTAALVACAILIAMTGFASAEDAAFTPRDIETVYKQAMANRDASLVAIYYADDATLFTPNGGTLKGRDAIEKDIAGGYATSARELTNSEITVDGGDDRKTLIWNWTLKIAPDNGKEFLVRGRSLHVWVNGDDGWKIVYDIFQTF